MNSLDDYQHDCAFCGDLNPFEICDTCSDRMDEQIMVSGADSYALRDLRREAS